MSRHRQIPTLQIWWHPGAQEESCFCEVITQLYVPLAYAGSEISDQLYFTLFFYFFYLPLSLQKNLERYMWWADHQWSGKYQNAVEHYRYIMAFSELH